MQNNKQNEIIKPISTIGQIKSPGNLKNRFKNAYDNPLFSKFQPMKIKSSSEALSVRFPISHFFNANLLCDVIDDISPHHFFNPTQKKKDLESFLELKFRLVQDDLHLSLSSCSFPHFFEYNLNKLLTLMASLSFTEFDNSVHYGRISIGHLDLVTCTLTINHEFKINNLQHALFGELLTHEGKNPALGSWMPVGSVETLKKILRDSILNSEDVSVYIP